MVTIIDAKECRMGRLATSVAKRLLNEEEIAVVNAEKAVVTGKEKQIKEEYERKRDVGSSRKGPFYPRMPHMILKRAIRGMLPYQKPSGRKAYKRLRVYIGVPKEFEGKKFEYVEEAKRPASYATRLDELSNFMGAKI
ncbi:MAG TPA: 50S ribosomal protein L13 [Thermoplasmata archaeon]|nr:50S ribosomal protein L13 [Thermoplasmata archaeon]HIH97526.1 50S ribosomal protein L13 [Thermoplasmata archaeon]